MKQTATKQCPAPRGVAKAMPTTSQIKNEQKQQTRMNLVSLLPAGNQAAVLSFLPKSPLCGHTGTVKISDSYEKILWKAYCQRDNKEIQNYRLANRRMETEV